MYKFKRLHTRTIDIADGDTIIVEYVVYVSTRVITQYPYRRFGIELCLTSSDVSLTALLWRWRVSCGLDVRGDRVPF